MFSSETNYITSTVENGIRTIRFNKPAKKNALCGAMYVELTRLFEQDVSDESIKGTILTGMGQYYSSGNDLTAQTSASDEEINKSINIVENFVSILIDYPKLLVAVVNGPALGIAVTSLALCDIVYCSETATFCTPFSKLALCPEGCSSFLFPRIMGRSKASEMLFLGHTMTAQEAYTFGLVSKVFPIKDLEKVLEDVHKFGQLPTKALIRTKKMINSHLKDTLHAANKMECKELTECLNSQELWDAMSAYFSKKSKL